MLHPCHSGAHQALPFKIHSYAYQGLCKKLAKGCHKTWGRGFPRKRDITGGDCGSCGGNQAKFRKSLSNLNSLGGGTVYDCQKGIKLMLVIRQSTTYPSLGAKCSGRVAANSQAVRGNNETQTRAQLV